MSAEAISVILPRPSLPPDSAELRLPESMNSDDRAFLITELGKLAGNYARLEARDEEREKALDARFKRLEARMRKVEDRADASGAHAVVKLETALKEREERAGKTRDRVISVVITFVVTAVLALIGFYLKFLGG